MKALSVLEPWASLIIQHGKNVENRTWRMAYRGPLVICASKRIEPGWNQDEWECLLESLGDQRPQALPDRFRDFQMLPGYALGVVGVTGCDLNMTGNRWEAAGQFHIRLTNSRPFARPFPQKGQLGMFDVSEELIHAAW